MLETDIKSRINQLCDKLFNEGITNNITIVEQLSYLFFLKWLEVTDEFDTSPFRKERVAIESGMLPSLSSQLDTVRWSKIREMDTNVLVSHMAETVFPWLKTIESTNHIFSQHMLNAVFLISRPSLISEAMDVIDAAFAPGKPLPGNDTYWQQSAESYAFLLERLGTAAKSGHLYTPKRLVEILVGLARATFETGVADLACGTGSVLVAIQKAYQKQEKGKLTKSPVIRDLQLAGFDTDPFNVRISMLNLMLNGIIYPQIAVQGLSDFSRLTVQYALVVSRIPSGTIQYIPPDLQSKLVSRRSEILYTEQVINHLTPRSGRAVLLIPSNILTEITEEGKALRNLILRSADLEAVFSIDESVKKYGADLAIICFTNSIPVEATAELKVWPTQKVWFQRIGDEEVNIAIERFQNRWSYITKEDEDPMFAVAIEELALQEFNLGIDTYRRLPTAENPAVTSAADSTENTSPATPKAEETLAELLTKASGAAGKISLPTSLSRLVFNLLPAQDKELASYVMNVKPSELLESLKGRGEKLTANALVNLLKYKKGEIALERLALAQGHPYYETLKEICTVKLGGGKRQINLLDISQNADLREFSVAQLARATEHHIGLDQGMNETWLTERLHECLLQFVATAKSGFTFQTLQTVLGELLFLPNFGVLRNFVWNNLGPVKYLRQQYVPKEASYAAPGEVTKYTVFTTMPGHIHLIHASNVTPNPVQS